MAKFVFEYEALLRKRRHDERVQMGRVAEIERERIALEAEIRAYQETIIEEKRDLARRLDAEKSASGDWGRTEWSGEGDGGGGGDGATGMSGGGVDLRAVRMQANASLRLIDLAQRAVIRLKGVHDRLDSARLELVDLRRQRRAIELLREQRHEAWKREQSRREQADLDELAVLRHGRDRGFPERGE